MVVPEVMVLAGRTVSFFLEVDQHFRLPFAMYKNDPSLYMAIPAAGIKPQAFTSTTRVNKEAKRFTVSQISYGDTAQDVAYPNTTTSVTLRFIANVELPPGTEIALSLPGFICRNKEPQVRSPLDFVTNDYQKFTPRMIYGAPRHVGFWDE